MRSAAIWTASASTLGDRDATTLPGTTASGPDGLANRQVQATHSPLAVDAADRDTVSPRARPPPAHRCQTRQCAALSPRQHPTRAGPFAHAAMGGSIGARARTERSARRCTGQVARLRGAPSRRSARHAGRGVASLVTHRGVSRPAAGVMTGCISAGARSRAWRRQTGQRGLCCVHDGWHVTASPAIAAQRSLGRSAHVTPSDKWLVIFPDPGASRVSQVQLA
jgi:hypothetical protein